MTPREALNLLDSYLDLPKDYEFNNQETANITKAFDILSALVTSYELQSKIREPDFSKLSTSMKNAAIKESETKFKIVKEIGKE